MVYTYEVRKFIFQPNGRYVMEYTKKLADYAVELHYEDLPKEAIEQAKLLTLHTIGVALASYPTAQAKKAIALAKDMGGGKNDSTLFGDGAKVSCVNAGFANGTMADALDWGDCSWTGHASAAAIPAALAVAESIKASGKEYITSVVAGYEVYQRIAMAVQPSDKWDWLVKGWGLTTWQIFAAVIPAAKLLRLDKDKMAQAIGIAGILSPIVNPKPHVSMSDVKPYQYGFICRDGIAAALLAKSGIDSLYDVLDGENGYWNTISDQCDRDWYVKGLGKDYLIMETLFKHWPANMWIQSPLDILEALVRDNKIKYTDISEIIVSPSFQNRMAYRPEGFIGMKDAEFSIPYCIAVYLLDPEPGPNWYTEERVKNSIILQLAGKVKATGPTQGLQASFKMFASGSFPEVSIKIVLNDGKEFAKSLRYPKGHPKNRLDYDEFKNRFRRAASFALKSKKIKELSEKILNMEEIKDVSVLSKLMHE